MATTVNFKPRQHFFNIVMLVKLPLIMYVSNKNTPLMRIPVVALRHILAINVSAPEKKAPYLCMCLSKVKNYVNSQILQPHHEKCQVG